MRFGRFTFGSIEIDGTTYEHDVVIDRGTIRKRRKRPSRPLRDRYGHTPLTAAEDIPWECRRLVIGTGADGRLPLADDVEQQARERGIARAIMPTIEAIDEMGRAPGDTNAILHVTC